MPPGRRSPKAHGRIERQCVRPAILGPLNTQNAVEEVHLILSKLEQGCPCAGLCAQTRRSFRRGTATFRFSSPPARGGGIVRGEISESRLVAVEELHATDGIRCGQVACHAPVEERLQDREILVDGGVSDFQSSPQFDVFNQCRRDLRQERARLDIRFPYGERRLDIRMMRAILDGRVFTVLLECRLKRDGLTPRVSS